MPIPVSPLPANVRIALQQGNTVEAIKLLRQHSSLGLKEAKDAVDAYQQEANKRMGSLLPTIVRSSSTAKQLCPTMQPC